MKLKLLTAFLFLAVLINLCSARPAEEEYDYEEEPAPPPKPVARPIVGRRSPLIRAGAGSKASTTTTTTPTPDLKENEEEIVEEELPEEEEAAPAETSSTTESGRKLKGGILRPFRSNEDLLATLKKRREQAVSNKNHLKAQVHEPQESSPVASEAEKPATPSKPKLSSGRRKFNKNDNVNQDAEVSSSAPARTSRRFRN
ncbi:uncharacterized protein LOC108735010 [Agrilus planipennis]|uniref:Uncharacterized protein LOC108735010 n=1 Tax=Agrilus planipennis TaxID=224129 RepID=A0A1W4WQI6_AGRPL|nr:uncharacterized protein LOC108735010 [Agrilus planipennis]